jgi:outer membrane lipoprotein
MMKKLSTFVIPCIELLLFPLLLVSCAPVFSEHTMEQVTPDVSLKEVKQDPESYRGKTVIWGGMIQKVKASEKEILLQILQLPLDFRHKPMNVFVGSEGSFLALSKRSLDLKIFDRGRFVTIVGEVQGKLSPALGESKGKYPLLLVRAIHPWPGTGKNNLYDRAHYWQIEGNGGR